MAVYDVSVLVLYLAIYSFLGWIVEVAYVFVTTQKLENRGFLTGPFLPIYGVGAVLLVLLVIPYVKNPFLVFLASFVITTALEFVTHLALDKIFHIRLWDYSDKPFNIRGRVCLQNSLMFGVLGLLLIYVLHPLATVLVKLLSQPAAISVASVLLGILLVDAANSFLSLAKVRPELDKMKGSLAQVHDKIEADARAEAAKREARRSALQSTHAWTVSRLTRNFPKARSTVTSTATPASPR
jgi:uncharacterized membrane protein